MRVFVALAALTAVSVFALAPAAAQSRDENWEICVNDIDRFTLDQQIAACSRIIASGNESTENLAVAYQNRGNGYNRQRNYQRSMPDYNEAIRLNPRFANAYYNRGVSWGGQREYQRAIADYSQAIALDPTHGDAFGNRGHAYYILGNYRAAIADLDRALAIRHTAPDFGNRGASYYELGDYRQAIADFDQSLRLDPTSSIDYNSRGNAYYQLRNYDAAMADYDRAVQADPQNAIALRNRGLIWYNRGDYQRAIGAHSAALQVDPDYGAAYYSRAEAHAQLRDYEQALRDYDQATARDPDNTEYNNLSCWIRAAYLNRDYETARRYCDRAVELARGTDEEPNALDTRGMLNLRQNRIQAAWNDYDAAVRGDPSSAHYLFGRGVAALRLGREPEALADLARARQMYAGIDDAYRRYGIEAPATVEAPVTPEPPVAPAAPRYEPPPTPTPAPTAAPSTDPFAGMTGRRAFTYDCNSNQELRIIFDFDDNEAIINRIRQPAITLRRQPSNGDGFRFTRQSYELTGTLAEVRFRIGSGDPWICPVR